MMPTFQRSERSETETEGEWEKQDGATHLSVWWEFVRRFDGAL